MEWCWEVLLRLPCRTLLEAPSTLSKRYSNQVSYVKGPLPCLLAARALDFKRDYNGLNDQKRLRSLLLGPAAEERVILVI